MRPQSTTIAFFIAVLLLLISVNAFAAGIRFEPAAPDNRSWITADVYSYWCGPLDPKVAVVGNQIDIQLVDSPGACPAIPFYVPVKAQIGLLPPGIYTVRLRSATGQQAIAEDTLVVRDTHVFRAVPAGAPSTGGTMVELMRTTEAVWPFASFTVLFGDQPAEFTGQSKFVVRVPPHSPGVVDITVKQTLNGQTTETVAVAAFTYYDPAAAPDDTVFEPLLFPVAYDGPGAFGSQWTTESWISPGGATFFGAPCSGWSAAHLSSGAGLSHFTVGVRSQVKPGELMVFSMTWYDSTA